MCVLCCLFISQHQKRPDVGDNNLHWCQCNLSLRTIFNVSTDNLHWCQCRLPLLPTFNVDKDNLHWWQCNLPLLTTFDVGTDNLHWCQCKIPLLLTFIVGTDVLVCRGGHKQASNQVTWQVKALRNQSRNDLWISWLDQASNVSELLLVKYLTTSKIALTLILLA